MEIARRTLHLAHETAEEDISSEEVAARAFAEAECVKQITEELKDYLS